MEDRKEASMSKPNPVTWFEIYVKDMARARTFYEKTLGASLKKMDVPPTAELDEMWSFPSAGEGHYGSSGALVKMPGGPAGNGGTLVYFECEDCGVAAKRVAPNGGTLKKDKFPIGPHGYIAIATDTEGNGFGLHSMK
jgi:predicted enzyme related to lactoylglutathione lyase